MFCEYGCGNKAKYPPKKGRKKWCCEDSFTQCPKIKEKNSSSNKGKIGHWKNKVGPNKNKKMSQEQKEQISETRKKNYIKEEHPNFGKSLSEITKSKISEKIKELNLINEDYKRKQSESRKLTLKDIKDRYKKFCNIEEIREINKKIEVKCKYCEEWFTPSYYSLYERIRNIEKDYGNGKNYLFCSKEHQYLSEFSIRKNPKDIKKFEDYINIVGQETYKSVRDYSDKIKNLHLRGIELGYDLDHKYSMYEGFKNNVDPKIIAHWCNLEVIKDSKNRSKRFNCNITLNELINLIDESKKIKENIKVYNF